MSIITRINKAEKRIVDLYNKLKNLPSGGGGVQTISGDFVDNTDPLNPILNDPRPYKVYTALLNQSGTNAPVATVLENTLGGEVVWNRISDGVYNATLSLAFVENKTFLNLSYNHENDVTGSSNGLMFRVNQNTIQLESGVIGDIRYDSTLINTPIEIRVYN